jgi:hypothetical protein
MGKSMTSFFFARLLLVGGFAASAGVLMAQPATSSATNPVACTFLEWGDRSVMIESGGPQEEQDYDMGVAAVYSAWCKPGTHTAEEKSKAADQMVGAWQKLWQRKNPVNTMFHQSGPLDMLALLGLTHAMPPLLESDAALTKEWADACSHSCFRFFFDPSDAGDQARIINLFRLHHEVQRNLKQEPAAEPVLDMLKKAEFPLGG